MDTFFSSLTGPEHFFKLLLVLMAAIWVSGRMFRLIKLPAVLGEILAGIVLGPAVMGVIPATETLKILAEMGVFFLMLHAGLETDPKELTEGAKTSFFVAISAIIPLSLFTFCLLHFAMDYSVFTALFMGAVIPLNSIPVIISVLKSFHLHKTPLGHTVLGASVINEVILFIFLSVILMVANTGEFSLSVFLFIIAKVIFFFGVTFFVGLKILPYSAVIYEKGKKGFTFSVIIALLFGLFAEAIGLHIILGAYLAGMFIRAQIESDLVRERIEDRFYGIAYSFLGPIFFVMVGMTISFTVLLEKPLIIFLLLMAMIFLQWLGSGLAAYTSRKFSARESSILAISLTGRGGTEMIVAQIGVTTFIAGTSLPLLPNELFSAVVILAFFSTLLMPFIIRILEKKWRVHH